MQIQVTINADPRSWRRLRRVFIVGTAVLAIAIPAAVWASHDFTDVPTSDQFHTQISAIKGAGITTGCTATTYCPTDFVRRDAMAAFMHRGFGRVALASGSFLAAPSYGTFGSVLTKTITVPGAAGTGTQFVEVHGSVSIAGTGASAACPCSIGLVLRDTVTGAQSLNIYERIDTAGFTQHNYDNTWVFSVPAGTSKTYSVDFAVFQATTGFSINNAKLIITTYPFGATGGTTLSKGASTGPDGAARR